MPPSAGKHVFLSGRFDGGPKERRLREICEHVQRAGWQCLAVDARPGQSFGTATERGLYEMHSMVAVAYDGYGEKTDARHCTYYELRYANAHHKPIIPLRFSEAWPPVPGGASREARVDAEAQLSMIFDPTFKFIDARALSSEQCAKEVCNRLGELKQRGDIHVVEDQPRDEAEEAVLAILRRHESMDGPLERAPSRFREAGAETAKVAFVGPTGAGKTMLINALLGQLLLPSRTEPNSVLPVHVLAQGRDAPHKLRFRGTGLGDVLAETWTAEAVSISSDVIEVLLDVEPAGDHVHGIWERLDEANNYIRRAFAECEDYSGLSRRFPRVSGQEAVLDWRAEVEVPADLRLPCVLVDCPGGGELATGTVADAPRNALVGSAIHGILRHQLADASLAVLVVGADNLAPVLDAQQTANFLGGRAGKETVLVVNKVESPKDCGAARRFLQDARGRLGEMHIGADARFLVSAHFALARKALTQLHSSAPRIDLDGFLGEHGLEGRCSDARSLGLGDIGLLRHVERSDIMQELQSMGVGRLKAVKLAADLQSAAGADGGCLPRLADLAEDRGSRQLLRFLYEVMNPYEEPEISDRDVHLRAGLPARVERLAKGPEGKRVDTERLEAALADLLTERKAQLVTGLAVERVIQMAEAVLVRCEEEASASRRSAKVAKNAQSSLAAALEETALDALRQALARRLEPWAGQEDCEAAAEALAAAPPPDQERLAELTDRKFAVELQHWAWAPHETVADPSGTWQIRGFGPCVTVLAAFHDWAFRSAAASLAAMSGEASQEALHAACGEVLGQAAPREAAQDWPPCSGNDPLEPVRWTVTEVALLLPPLALAAMAALLAETALLQPPAETYPMVDEFSSLLRGGVCLLGAPNRELQTGEWRLGAAELRRVAQLGARRAAAAAADQAVPVLTEWLCWRAEAKEQEAERDRPGRESAERNARDAATAVEELKAWRGGGARSSTGTPLSQSPAKSEPGGVRSCLGTLLAQSPAKSEPGGVRSCPGTLLPPSPSRSEPGGEPSPSGTQPPSRSELS